jgi:hypothetical protein
MRDSGHAGQAVPDTDVLEFATGEHRAVVTLNRRHFVRLHQDRPGHAGIIVCTFDMDFAGLAQRIHHTIADSSTPSGQLLRVNRPS